MVARGDDDAIPCQYCHDIPDNHEGIGGSCNKRVLQDSWEMRPAMALALMDRLSDRAQLLAVATKRSIPATIAMRTVH